MSLLFSPVKAALGVISFLIVFTLSPEIANAQQNCGIYSISTDVVIFDWQGSAGWQAANSQATGYNIVVSVDLGCPSPVRTKVTPPPVGTEQISIGGPTFCGHRESFLDSYCFPIFVGVNNSTANGIGSFTITEGNGPPFYQENWPNPFTFSVGAFGKPPCTYQVKATTSTSFANTGGSGQITVTTTPNSPNCNWDSWSTASWISAASSGAGNGSVSFSVAANTGATGRSGTIMVADQSISISQGALQITTNSLPQATSGVAYGPVALAATGGSGNYSWSASGLPVGFAISGSTIVSSGSPAATPDTYNVTLTVTDTQTGLTATTASPLPLIVQGPLQITSVDNPPTYVYIGSPPTPIGPSSAFPSGVTNVFVATATVSNPASVASTPDILRFYLSFPQQADVPIGSSAIPAISANQSVYVTANITIVFGTPAGRYFLKACVASACVPSSKTSAMKALVIDFESAVANGVQPPTISGGTIDWLFQPNFAFGVPSLSTSQAAALGGFSHLNWYQSIVSDSIRVALGVDPSLGGNFGQKIRCFPSPGADYLPWYYNEVLLGCTLADQFYIGNSTNLSATSLSFVDNPNALFPGRVLVFETYLAGVSADGSGQILAGIPNVHIHWKFTQTLSDPTVTDVTVGAQAPPGQSWGVSEFIDYIGPNDFTPDRIRRLKLNGVFPADASLSIAPSSGPQWESLDVTINGNGTYFVQSSSVVSFSGTGITVNSVKVSSPTEAVANVTIAKDALVFPRDAYVATGTEVAAAHAVFGITPVLGVNIAIKPDGRTSSPTNSKSQGKIPVAILSTPSFSAPASINIPSLTFGRTGRELAIVSCESTDINNDGIVDLMCHFQNDPSGFLVGDTTAVLRGFTNWREAIKGEAPVTVLPSH